MYKYIAFDLYKTNEQGGHQPAVVTSGESREVYLAADVHALLERVRDAIKGDEGSVLDEVNSILMESATK